MEVTEENNETPTLSQERMLLNEDATSMDSTHVAQNVGPPNNTNKPATLADLRNIISSNASRGVGEITVALQTGTVIVTKPNSNRSRSRSKAKRMDANRKSVSLVNPHDRIKNAGVSETPSKRPREAGDTPPSANQPNKKSLGNLAEPKPGNSNEGKTNAAKKRLKKKKQNKAKLNSNKNAGNQAEVDMSVPPLSEKPKSIGSDASTSAGNQPPAVSVTKVTESANMQSQGEASNDKEVAPQSYAQVVDNLCVAIIDQRNQGQMQLLDQSRFDKLNALLTDAILAQAGTSTTLPEFDDTRLHSGAMRVRCANANTRKWLERNVPKLDVKKLWHGARLVVIDFKDIPKPHKFNVLFRNVKKSPKDLFCLLEKQNKGITTKSWSVLHCGQKDGGTHMTIGVGQDSFETLRERSNSLYCGMGKAVFTVVKGCKENKSILQTAAGNTDAANTVPVQSTSSHVQREGSSQTAPADGGANDIGPTDMEV